MQPVAKSTVRTPDAPPAKFDTSLESLQFNSKLLQEFGFYFEIFLACHRSTILGLGPIHLPKAQQLMLSAYELPNLQLWLKFLNLPHAGLCLNRFTLHRPTQLGLSNSCPFDLAGFTIKLIPSLMLATSISPPSLIPALVPPQDPTMAVLQLIISVSFTFTTEELQG
jgi:hypothetical protein